MSDRLLEIPGYRAIIPNAVYIQERKLAVCGVCQEQKDLSRLVLLSRSDDPSISTVTEYFQERAKKARWTVDMSVKESDFQRI